MAKPEVKPSAPPAAPAAAAAPARAAAIEIRPVTPLIVARWSEAQFTQNRHAVRPEANTPYEHLLDPAYFAHIAPKIIAGDVIEVRPAEGGYYAELYVWAKGPNWLQVSELVKVDRPKSSALPSPDRNFSIEFIDGPHKHRVIRNSDRSVVAQGFERPEDANLWIAQNAKRVAA